jgi:hypothetical protein
MATQLHRHSSSRFLLASIAGSIVFAVILNAGCLSSTGFSGLSAGAVSVSSCTSSHVTVNYVEVFVPGVGYAVETVTLNGVDTGACAGRRVQITLSDGQGVALASGLAPVPVAEQAIVVPLGSPVPLATLSRVDVAIG